MQLTHFNCCSQNKWDEGKCDKKTMSRACTSEVGSQDFGEGHPAGPASFGMVGASGARVLVLYPTAKESGDTC